MDEIYKIITTEKGKTWDRLVTNPSNFKKCEKASLKEKFDFYIKQSFIDGNPYLPGLYIDNNKPDNFNFGFLVKRYDRIYDRYLSNNLEIENVLSKDEIRNKYDDGKGNEFLTGKYYSVASSSRFATACFSKKDEGGLISLVDEIEIGGVRKRCKIELEKGLKVFSENGMVISEPQMDVVIETNDDVYFIEAKCHEILDNHNAIKLKWKYWESEQLKSFLGDCSSISELLKKENKKQVSYIGINNKFLTSKDFGCNLITNHFDFKQFLCHLLGILSYQELTRKHIHFYYLFYKNEEYLKNVKSKLYGDLEDEMNQVFDHFKKFCPGMEFGYMYYNRYDTMNAIKLKKGFLVQTPLHI